jgi:hypothetical protein
MVNWIRTSFGHYHAVEAGGSGLDNVPTRERLTQEIAAGAGLTAEQFRELPERERDRMIGDHTRRTLGAE